jgi:archaemetzincin
MWLKIYKFHKMQEKQSMKMGKGILIFLIGLLVCACTIREKSIVTKPDIIVALQPFDGFDPDLSDSIAHALEHTYLISVHVLPNENLPASAFINVKSPRYRADSLIRYLRRIRPDTADYIMGLTHADISVTKRDKHGMVLNPSSRYADWGVLGLGFRPGVSCVVSTFRMKHSSNSIFISRLRKVFIHELGHNFGLAHCESTQCVMRDAVEKIKTVDDSGEELCDACRAKIRSRVEQK